jgi:predicted GIY-YIG superfamily endonuclease
MSVAADTLWAMHDLPEDPQTLYQAWKGHWPFRQWLYVGITNSPSRRFGEHRRRSEWMLEAGTIRLARFPDRESVMEAERRMIRAKRPHYNVQHNRHEVEVELSAENLAAAGAAVCLSVLTLRWLADVSSEWWVKRQARRQGVTVELPPRRNPFTEPSLTLTMLAGFCTVMAGGQAPTRPAVPPVAEVPVMATPTAESSAAEPQPVWARADSASVSMPAVPVQAAAVIAALLIMLAACAAAAAVGRPEN